MEVTKSVKQESRHFSDERFKKIDNPNNKVLSSLDIETGRLYEMYSVDEVIPVDGCFVEGMVEHDT